MTAPDVAARDCAGQAWLVRDVKRGLDAAMGGDWDASLSGRAAIAAAKGLAFRLACELETYESMCAKCGGMT